MTFPSLSEALAHFCPWSICSVNGGASDKRNKNIFFALSDYWIISLNCGYRSAWTSCFSKNIVSQSGEATWRSFLFWGGFALPATHWSGLRLPCSSNHWYSAILLFLLLSLQVSLLGQDICADTAAVVSVNWKGSNKRRTWLGKQFFDWDESIASNKIFFGMIPVFFCRLAELIVSYLWPKNCFSKTSLLYGFAHRRNGRLNFSCKQWEQMFMGFLHSPPYSFYCSFSWEFKTDSAIPLCLRLIIITTKWWSLHFFHQIPGMVVSTWSCVLHSPEEKQAPNPDVQGQSLLLD